MSVDVEALYKRYFPMVYRRCLRLLADSELAADTAQDVFVRIHARRDALNGEYPSSLLYRIATNASLNALRSRRRRRDSGGGDLLETIACGTDVAGETVARSFLDSLFSRLESDPARVSTRTIAVLRYVDGLTLEETAEVCGLSVSAVRKRLRVLRERSRALFPEEEA